MKSFSLLALLGLYFTAQTLGQSVLTVTTATYFDKNVGGNANYGGGLNYNGPIFCRDGAEAVAYPSNPSQSSCPSYGFATPPIDQGRWGQSALGVATQMSGLGFQGIKGQQVSAGQDFYLGQLTHFNWPIYAGTAASAINMNIFFSYTPNGATSPTTKLFTFNMLIDETPNQAPCQYPGTTPCADKISFNTSFNFATTFEINPGSGIQYTLVLEGFKESNSSSSSPLSYFISNENANTQAYLFARITEACPSTCVNGGAYIINDGDCSCDCSSVTCAGVKVTSPNCTCVCPTSKTCQNGGRVNTNSNGCECICSNTCPSPLVRNDADCSCNCPANICHVGGTVSNPTTCACNCPTTPCSISNQVRNSSCDCVCSLTCQSPKVRSNQTGVCGCVCANTCPAGYTINQNTCQCACTRTCINSVLNNATCTCGPCLGNFTVDASTGQCTTCPASVAASCNSNEKFDATSCSCSCQSLNCNLQNNGQVVDTTKACACRNCTAGECVCGNGKVEVGEECDPGNSTDPCCVQCKYTTAPCEDGNLCTINSFCNGKGTCVTGDYKCNPSTECVNITCNPTVGTCVTTPTTDNTPCGSTPYNLCNSRCIAGVCDTTKVVCGADNNTQDCYVPQCDVLTGSCPYVSTNDSSPCSDGDACTTNDACTKGVCKGDAIKCPAPDQCHNATCQYGQCVPFALEGRPCNADNNKCTVGDICSGGNCLPGLPKVCQTNGTCVGASCDAATGDCNSYVIPNYLNKTCDDLNICTYQDVCTNGTCKGVKNPAYQNSTVCGFVPIGVASEKTVQTTSIAIIAALGAATLIGAIIGLAVLIKRIQAKKLLNPDTWNPDMFSSLGSNPLYKGNTNNVNNALYEGRK